MLRYKANGHREGPMVLKENRQELEKLRIVAGGPPFLAKKWRLATADGRRDRNSHFHDGMCRGHRHRAATAIWNSDRDLQGYDVGHLGCSPALGLLDAHRRVRPRSHMWGSLGRLVLYAMVTKWSNESPSAA